MGLIIYVISIRKKYIEEVSHLPLEEESIQNQKGGYPHA
jgi:hypothetical protein